MRIRPRLALEYDFLATVMAVPVRRRAVASQRASIVARPLQVLRRVDAERHAVDDGDVDAHAGFERAQLLELLALFERRGRQADEARERRAAIGVKPDVMIERPVARRARWRG